MSASPTTISATTAVSIRRLFNITKIHYPHKGMLNRKVLNYSVNNASLLPKHPFVL